MKARIQKKTGKEARASRRGRRLRNTLVRIPASLGKAADRQVEEIERTFSLRYEW